MAAGSRCFPNGGGAFGRRAFLSGAAALAAAPAWAAGAPALRLGVLPFGTVHWVAETIRLNGLDRANGFSLQTAKLANTEAAKVGLMGHAVDVAVSDWPFVAAQRSHGGTLTFSPFSSSLGGIMVPAASPVRRLEDLKGLRLGVAGGAADKSWLIVRAAAAKQGIDLARSAQLSFGAPPLLSATLAEGGLDALLTFWNFCARLQAGGLREAISVADCARILGLHAPPVLVGYVFDAAWAGANPALIEGFLKASVMAETLLATRPAQWQAIRPFMDAPGDALFQNLKSRFLEGISRPDAATLRAQATQLLAVLAQHGTSSAPGPGASLPDGVFWQGT
jgi:NitT/TauT family transport system substrate-binding protein